jgi:hypothetical protein
MKHPRTIRDDLEALLFAFALGCLVVGGLGGIALARVVGWGRCPP